MYNVLWNGVVWYRNVFLGTARFLTDRLSRNGYPGAYMEEAKTP